ncbi:pilus assembly protein [Ornithinimicrobium murale]|uniref:pilus assembly protein n=1 Tax=Ornithinimicrobium murale TaxID=1050153 RepID=UPI0013B3C60A|nr:pilus assembly protein [Ornithinimicrobium murale]
MMAAALRWWKGQDRGSGLAIEGALLGTALLALLVLVAAAGRVSGAHVPIDSAANNAARAASISRSHDQAHAAAMDAATTTLSGQGSSCPDPAITVDTSGLNSPPGQVGLVHVTIRCTVQLSDLSGLDLPGTRTITAEATSVVDAYRAKGGTP